MISKKIVKQSKIFNISSKYAFSCNNTDPSYLSDVTFSIPNFISNSQGIEDLYVSVEHCEIPISFYLINEYNNIIAVNGTLYTIPSGNYNYATLSNALVTLLGSNYSFSINKATDKITMVNSVSDFSISSTLSTCRSILGFSKTGVMYSSNKTLAFPYPINLLPLPRLLIKCPELSLDNFQSSDNSNDVLLSLQNNGGFGQMIMYDNSSSLSYYLGDVDQLNMLNIKISDDDGKLINFNNVHWYITLRIDYSYTISKTDVSFESIILSSVEHLKSKLISEN